MSAVECCAKGAAPREIATVASEAFRPRRDAPIRAGFMSHASALALPREHPVRAELRATLALALPLAGANLVQMAV